MLADRDLDIEIAQEIFDHTVFMKDGLFFEKAEQGDQLLKKYSQNIEDAWIVAEKMRISIIPVQGDQWFAFTAANEGWTGPDAFLEYLMEGNFDLCGAAVESNPAKAICFAALVAKKKTSAHPYSRHKALPIIDNPSIN